MSVMGFGAPGDFEGADQLHRRAIWFEQAQHTSFIIQIEHIVGKNCYSFIKFYLD